MGIDLRTVESQRIETLALTFPSICIDETIRSTVFHEVEEVFNDDISSANKKGGVFILHIDKINTSGIYTRLEPNELKCLRLPEKEIVIPRYENWSSEELLDCWEDTKISHKVAFNERNKLPKCRTLSKYNLKANYNTVVATLEFTSDSPDEEH